MADGKLRIVARTESRRFVYIANDARLVWPPYQRNEAVEVEPGVYVEAQYQSIKGDFGSWKTSIELTIVGKAMVAMLYRIAVSSGLDEVEL